MAKEKKPKEIVYPLKRSFAIVFVDFYTEQDGTVTATFQKLPASASGKNKEEAFKSLLNLLKHMLNDHFEDVADKLSAGFKLQDAKEAKGLTQWQYETMLGK